jgi:hypothetical protein
MGKHPQHLVPNLVAVSVIDVLKAIEINEHKAHLGLRSPAPFKFMVKSLDEPAAIK